MIDDLFVGVLVTVLGTFLVWVVPRLWKARHPVELVIEQFVDDHWEVAFPHDLPDVSDISGVSRSPDEVYRKLIDKGAVDVGITKVRLRLRSRIEDPILIKQIFVDSEKRLPLSGVRIMCPTAGVNGAIILLVDLDEDNPRVWGGKEEDFEFSKTDEHPFFARNDIDITKDKYTTLVLVGRAQQYCVSWRLRMEIRIRNRDQYLIVDSGGNPFRTSGEPADGFLREFEWGWHEGHQLIPRSSDNED